MHPAIEGDLGGLRQETAGGDKEEVEEEEESGDGVERKANGCKVYYCKAAFEQSRNFLTDSRRTFLTCEDGLGSDPSPT